MSKNDTIGAITCALPGMNPKYLGLVRDVANRLNRPEPEAAAYHGLIASTLKNRPLASKETQPDTLIRIMRPVKPKYPDCVKQVMHPELEDVGLGEYDLASIDPWLHDGQRNGGHTTGNHIYEDFKRNNSLKICLGLRDGEEIQKKGIVVFRQFFGGKAVFLWKSVVQLSHGSLHVPYLYEDGGEVVLHWRWLDHGWHGDHPAARFAS